MTVDPGHRRLGSVMWGAIGVTFMILAVVAVYRLDSRIAGFVVGALILTCLTVCGAAVWLDIRSAGTTTRLVNQLRRRSSH